MCVCARVRGMNTGSKMRRGVGDLCGQPLCLSVAPAGCDRDRHLGQNEHNL